jgi:hypothetical protein
MTEEQIKLLEEWRQAKAEADSVKPILAKEQELRKQVFAAFYPAPKEGTNTLDLAGGWKLKGVYKLDRKIDEAALPAVAEQLREMGVNVDTLIKWSPGLKTATYKELTAEQRAVFDQALIVKPGAPIIELVPPKAEE